MRERDPGDRRQDRQDRQDDEPSAAAQEDAVGNQARAEPMPAAPEESGGAAVRRNEELGALGTASDLPPRAEAPANDQAADPPERVTGAVPAAQAPQNAPGVQVAQGEPEHDGDQWRVRDVANAVHGSPDGEVDTRADQPSTGSDTP
ncbi:hypothetical protein CLV63_11465 [Murinocardiopsis flavida]|uniref:Uncharacterized protein n=1 Tax=Murinocardiopsis flavida TaxID=645275 RepID=A0A2P8DEJ6_9ACTN|nr:hypothetical protein [Murinocardiopsis flavida]PSK95632.1 hypothetical protein CLV63_11465 [Murinocardiopsis flavida]